MVTPEFYAQLVKNIANAKRAREARTQGGEVEPLESMKTSEPIRMNLICSPSEDEAKLNKLESDWLAYRRSLNAQWIGVQCMSLKLGSDCRYLPDFIEILNGNVIAWETKGFMRPQARVKLKVAARMYPWIIFKIVTRKNKEWKIETVKP